MWWIQSTCTSKVTSATARQTESNRENAIITEQIGWHRPTGAALSSTALYIVRGSPRAAWRALLMRTGEVSLQLLHSHPVTTCAAFNSLSLFSRLDGRHQLLTNCNVDFFLFYYPFSNKGEDQESSFLPSKVVNNNRCHFLCRLTSQTVRLQPVVTTEEGRVTHIRSQFTVNDYARPPTRIKEYFMLELSKSLHNMRLGRSAAHHMKLAKVTKGCPGLMKINDVCARSGPRRTLCLFPQQRLSRLRHPRQQIDISGSPVNSYMPSCSSAINPQHPHWELLGQKKRKKERNLTFTWYFPSNLPLLIRPHLRGNISASLMARANENDEREGKHLLFSSVAWWKRKCPIDSQDSRPSFVTLTLFHQYRHLHSRQKESSTFFFVRSSSLLSALSTWCIVNWCFLISGYWLLDMPCTYAPLLSFCQGRGKKKDLCV